MGLGNAMLPPGNLCCSYKMLFVFVLFPFSFKAFSEQTNEKLHNGQVRISPIFSYRSNIPGKTVSAAAFLFGF